MRIEAALALPKGTLLDMAAWERTPKQVRKHVEELESRDRVVRRLVDLMSGSSPGRDERRGAMPRRNGGGISLDAAYRSGALQRLTRPSGENVAPEGRGGVATDTARHHRKPAELAVRLAPYPQVSHGHPLAVSVRMDAVHFFDQRGDRIDVGWR